VRVGSDIRESTAAAFVSPVRPLAARAAPTARESARRRNGSGGYASSSRLVRYLVVGARLDLQCIEVGSIEER
jgi:hypothetical protein